MTSFVVVLLFLFGIELGGMMRVTVKAVQKSKERSTASMRRLHRYTTHKRKPGPLGDLEVEDCKKPALLLDLLPANERLL